MPIHNPATGKPDVLLGDKLFRLVEEAQGKAFISDGIDVFSRKEILALARGSLKWSRIVVRKLEGFLRRYDDIETMPEYCDMCGHSAEDHEEEDGIGRCHNGESKGECCPCGNFTI